jgi:cytoskeletal protein CcmA (bactofilin family)
MRFLTKQDKPDNKQDKPDVGNLEEEDRRESMAKGEDGMDSFLGNKSRLEGTLSFSGTLTMLGKFKGKVKGGETVVLGDSSESEADVEANHVTVHGKLMGAISGEKKVEIHREAQVEADVKTPSFVVHEGALFEGKCSMKKQRGGRVGEKVVDLKDGWMSHD